MTHTWDPNESEEACSESCAVQEHSYHSWLSSRAVEHTIKSKNAQCRHGLDASWQVMLWEAEERRVCPRTHSSLQAGSQIERPKAQEVEEVRQGLDYEADVLHRHTHHARLEATRSKRA